MKKLMPVILCILAATLSLSAEDSPLSSALIQSKNPADRNALPVSVPPNVSALLRKALKDGTPHEKEAALEIIRDMKPISLIPEIIEAIEDPTPLPRHGDTGWGFVGHQAAAAMGRIAHAIDGIDVKTRGNGYDAYSFHKDQYKGGKKLKEMGRLSEVRVNWAEWWHSHRNK